MSYKSTKFIQNRWSHFWENQNFLFFSHVNYPYFRGRRKTKKTAWDIYKRTLDIKFEWDRSIGLGSTIGDGQTDREREKNAHTDRQTHIHAQTHRQTERHTCADSHVQTHACRDACTDTCRHMHTYRHACIHIKKIEVKFFDYCNTSFTPNVVRK